MTAHPKACITAVESDRRNLKPLHRCANLNGASGRSTIVEAAPTSEGTTRLIEDGSWVSRVEGIGAPPAGLDRGTRAGSTFPRWMLSRLWMGPTW